MDAVAAQVEEWKPVPEAARLAGLPPRTLYRWVSSGAIRAKQDGKKRSVDMADVRRVAAQRPQTAGIATVPLPGSAGALPASAPVAGGVAHVGPHSFDGELAARLFEKFDSGVAPADVVRGERLAPGVVLAAHETWRRLREAGGKPEPRPSEVAAAVRREIQAVAADLDGFRESLTDIFAERDATVSRLAQQLGQLSATLGQTVAAFNDLSKRVEFLGYVELARKLGDGFVQARAATEFAAGRAPGCAPTWLECEMFECARSTRPAPLPASPRCPESAC